jgi:hypothetical protein
LNGFLYRGDYRNRAERITIDDLLRGLSAAETVSPGKNAKVDVSLYSGAYLGSEEHTDCAPSRDEHNPPPPSWV